MMMFNFTLIANKADQGDFRPLSRLLTWIENGNELTTSLEEQFVPRQAPLIIGITGPPGSGKSTLLNALMNALSKTDGKLAVLAVDPSSPFTQGALLGDRIRMNEQYNKPNVFIRSMATRGNLGGLSPRTLETVDVLKMMGFNYIFIETVGVGQSEIDIASLADITLVVLGPESGDEIQNLKSGLMEIADVFIVNKYDREGAASFTSQLKQTLHYQHINKPIFTSVATQPASISQLIDYLQTQPACFSGIRKNLIAEKAWQMIQSGRMADINKEELRHKLTEALLLPGFNLHTFVKQYL